MRTCCAFFTNVSGILFFLLALLLLPPNLAAQAPDTLHPGSPAAALEPIAPPDRQQVPQDLFAELARPLSRHKANVRALWLEAIRITGNKRTKEKDILRHIHIRPGDLINVGVLDRERLRLLDTDYFTNVDFSTRPGSERGAVVLVIDVVERTYPLVETGFGYHDLHGWFLTLIGLRFDHAFGIESRTRVGVRLGFHLAGLDAEWEKPAPSHGGFGAAARLFVYAQQQQFFGSGPDTSSGGGSGSNGENWTGDDWRPFEQKIERLGGEVMLRYRPGERTRFSFGLKAETVEPESTFTDQDFDRTLPFDDLPWNLKPGVDRTLITGFVFRMIHDTRNHSSYPQSGSFARLMMGANSSLLGGDEIYTKVELDYRKHFHVGNGWVMSTRLNGGVISDGAPYFERFYIGGIYSIRGFRELSLSPTAGNDGYWLAGGELRWPLIASGQNSPRLTGLMFFDTGQGWQRGEIFSWKDIQSAAGYGIRLRLPWIGILGFDVGIPFSKGKTGDNFRVHGALGFSF